MRTRTTLAAALPLALTAVVAAGEINVGQIGGAGVTISSAPISDIVFASSGGGAPTNPHFTTNSLADLHTHIETNSVGISTENWITIVAGDVNTDGSPGADGMALLTLIDRQRQATPPFNIGGPVENQLTYSSFINDDTSANWINDLNDGFSPTVIGGVGTEVFDAFQWHSEDAVGDAFAWSGLEAGHAGTMEFKDLSWDEGTDGDFLGIQVLDWNDDTGKWEQVATFDLGEGNPINMYFQVVPLPAPALMAIAGLAGVVVARRRRD